MDGQGEYDLFVAAPEGMSKDDALGAVNNTIGAINEEISKSPDHDKDDDGIKEALRTQLTKLGFEFVTPVDSIPWDDTPESVLAYDDELRVCYQAVKEKLSSLPTHHTGEFNREIENYSDYPEEQAAYVKLCEATFKLGEALMAQPRGTFLLNDQGGYWLSDAAGELSVYMEMGQAPSAESTNLNLATYCEGVGESDLLEIAKTITESLKAPVFKQEDFPGLLDALVMKNFGKNNHGL